MTLSIDVEIDDASGAGDPLRGSIRRDDEPAAPFQGWLGLLTSLDQLLAAPTARPLTPRTAGSAGSADPYEP